MFLTKEQKLKYKILSRKACERYCQQKHEKTAIIISIRSSWDRELPNLPMNNDNKVKDVLFLSFDDIDMEENPKFAMQESDGVKIASFIDQYYDNTDVIIAHCDGGISRSAGVIAAIMRVKEKEDFPVFDSPSKHPNMTCYLMTLKGFKYI